MRVVLGGHIKIILSILILFCILNHELCAYLIPSENKDDNVNHEISVGIILDMDSWFGKSIHRCVTMAISDFYALNNNYRTRIVLLTRDTKGDPIQALSAVDHLLNNIKVQAILGPETQFQSKLLALFADKAKVPIFSFAGLSSKAYPYLLQIKDDESTMAKGIAAFVESYKWRKVAFIYEDTDDGREILPYLLESFQDKNMRISYKGAISASTPVDEIIAKLCKLMTFHTTIIIVHMSPSLASTFFVNAKRLGMVGEEHAWILTDKAIDVFRSTNFDVVESLQGALGFRSYVPASSRLYNLTARWHNFFYREHPTSVTKEVPVPAIWAYDTIWALAKSFEKVGVSHNGLFLLNDVSKVKFKGISGEFQLSGGKVISNGYEIMRAIDYGEKRVGYWTESEGLRQADLLTNSIHLYSGIAGNEASTWPVGSTIASKGRVLLQTNPITTLKIGVLMIRNFKYFIDVTHDIERNVTTATGFSMDVFDTCLRALPYNVSYVLISYENGTYDDLVQKVFNKEIDAVVGDSTILANRSDYVDFTATYTDLGVGTVARVKKKDMWFFLKSVDIQLVITFIASLMGTGFVIWVIEYKDDEKEPSPTIGQIFWLMLMTIFFSQGEQLKRTLSKIVLFIWLLVMLVFIVGYNATLSSLMTLDRFELASKGGIVGFHGNSLMRGVTISNLHFENHKDRPFYSYEDYAYALSEDGDADAIVDEIPYIKMFLGRYSGDYGLVSTQPITSGFAFIFQKGSPLVEDVSKEIAKIRLDGTLGCLEKRWFENQISIPSRNSTATKALTLDYFGGLFICNTISLALALMIVAVYKAYAIIYPYFEILFLSRLLTLWRLIHWQSLIPPRVLF